VTSLGGRIVFVDYTCVNRHGLRYMYVEYHIDVLGYYMYVHVGTYMYVLFTLEVLNKHSQAKVSR
jgi:hypothetical protein